MIPRKSLILFILFILSVSVLLVVSILPDEVRAQDPAHWKICDSAYLAAHAQYTRLEACDHIYFVRDRVGFAFGAFHLQPGAYHGALFRTTNGGVTFEACDTSSFYGSIELVSFEDVGHGYAWMFAPQSQSLIDSISIRLYETNDTGYTWHVLKSFGLHDSITWTPGDVTLFSFRDRTIFGPYSRIRGNSDVQPLQIIGHQIGEYNFGLGIENREDYGVIFAQRNALNVILATEDGGKTWKEYPSPLNNPVRSINLATIQAHSREIFIKDGFGSARQYVVHNHDLSQKWDSVLDVTGYALTPEIAGAGCATYTPLHLGPTSPAGMARTTDNGRSWVNITAPFVFPDYNTCASDLSVRGNGAVVYVFGNQVPNDGVTGVGAVWKTTDGGDGALAHISEARILSLQHTLTSQFIGDTLQTASCDSSSLDLSFQYTGACSYAWLDKVRIDGLDTSEYRFTKTSHFASENKPDTAWISIHPTHAGLRTLIVHAVYTNDDWAEMDTSFTIYLNVAHTPGRAVLSGRSAIDFGTQSLCSATIRKDSITLSASGCEAVSVDSVVFRPESSSIDFGFSNSNGSKLIATGDRAISFPITFKPTQPVLQSGWIYVYSTSGGVRSVDSVLVKGEGVGDSRAFLLYSDTLKASQCDSGKATVSITNTTCGTLTIDSVSLIGGVTMPPASNGQPQLPLTLGKDQSETVTVALSADDKTPIGSRTVQIQAHVRFVENGIETAFDTILTLPVTIGRGTPALALDVTEIDLGDVSLCADATAAAAIHSTGCDTLVISKAALAIGSNGFTETGKPGSRIVVGSSDSIHISFKPLAAGRVSDTIRIETNAGTRTIILKAQGVPGSRTLATSVNEIVFPETYACEERDTTVTLRNTGCTTLTITEADAGKYFGITNATFPIVLQPGESRQVTLTTHADTTGHPASLLGMFTVTSDAENTLTPITLTRSILYPATLRIEAVDDAAAHAGEIVRFRLRLEGSVPKAMTALHFDLMHNNDLLSFEKLSGAGLAVTSTTGNESQVQSFTLSPVADTGTIGELTFRTFLAKASTTPLTISNTRFDAPGLSLPSDCIASITAAGSDFTYVYECSGHTIQQFMQSGALRLDQNTPNPVTSSTGYRTEIGFTSALPGRVVLELRSETGALVFTTSVDLPRAGAASIPLDLRQLAAGTYTYSLSLSEGGAVAKRLMLVK